MRCPSDVEVSTFLLIVMMAMKTGGMAAGWKLKDNPHSKIFRSEYNFLVFGADERKCEMKAWTFGGLKTPDNERKLELVDARSWDPRKQADAGQ